MSSNISDDAEARTALHLADSALLVCQRLCGWIGHAPTIEEDIALGNVALDLLGHARLWYGVASARDALGRDEDAFAYGRDPDAFRHMRLAESPNGDFGQTQLRQYLFDTWHMLTVRALAGSDRADIAAVAQKTVKEISYHVRRSRTWVVRLGDGTAESNERMQCALDRLWPVAVGCFDAAPPLVDGEVVRDAWRDEVAATLRAAQLTPPEIGRSPPRDPAVLAGLLADMQALHRSHPGASW